MEKKMKRILTTLALAGTLFSSVAQAQWDFGTVTLAGKYNGNYFLKVNNVENSNNTVPSYSNKLFILSDGLGIDGFAIALAAVSSKRQIQFQSTVDSQGSDEYPIIKVMYLTDQSIPVSN
jgi:hypothetical protein